MSDEKTEEPTEHKLRKSREEGQMARSQDIPAAASTLAAVAALVALSEAAIERFRLIFRQALDFGEVESDVHLIFQKMGSMAFDALAIILPVVLAAGVGAAVGMAAHVGIQVAPKALTPKFENINPAQGIKRVFSMRSLVTFLLSVIKAAAIGVVMWQVILVLMPLVVGSIYQTPRGIGAIGWEANLKLFYFALGVFAVIAPLDYLLSRYMFLKEQRMTKDEVKREHKSQEGDPEIKGQRRNLAREMVESSPEQAMGRADALIVNPTHYAVALRYRADEAGVPVVLTKGVDDAALQLRALAQEMGVPIFANPPLARALHKVPENHAVPEEFFEAVSVVLRWVEDLAQRDERSERNAKYRYPTATAQARGTR